MDPDIHSRFGIAVTFSMLSIFPAVWMAHKKAPGSREQGESAY